MRVALVETPNPVDRQVVLQGLAEVNSPLYGQSQTQALSVFLYAEDNTVLGGALGKTHWGWLYIEALWVAPSYRRHGHGAALLLAAEAEAQDRGCEHAYLDTFSQDAKRFYERCGYQEFTVQADFPPGHQRFFLRKQLGDGKLSDALGGRNRRVLP